jgi:hypothetical protein
MVTVAVAIPGLGVATVPTEQTPVSVIVGTLLVSVVVAVTLKVD